MADGGTIVWRAAVGGADQARADLRSLGPAGAAGAQQTQDAWSRAGRAVGQQISDIAARAATPIQQRIDLLVDASGAGSARASASVFRQAEIDAGRLKAALDPLGTAQARYNKELERYRELARGGLLSAQDLTKAEEQLRRSYDATTDAIRRQLREQAAQGTARKGLSSNLRNTAIYTASDVVSQLGSGASFGQIAMQQGPQVLQAIAVEGGEAAAALGGLLNPLTAVIAAVAALGVAEQVYEGHQRKLNAELQGMGAASGVTIERLNAIAEASAVASGQAVGFAKDSATAFATVAQVTDQNLGAATQIVDRWAVGTGQKAKAAREELVKAFADPAAGAEVLNQRLKFLTAAQLDNIQSMQAQGDRAGALKTLIDALSGSLPGATDGMTGLARAGHAVKNGFSAALEGAGEFFRKLAGYKTTAEKLQEFDDRRSWFGYLPVSNDERQLRALAAKDKDRQAQAALDDRSQSAQAAYDRLNPQDSQISSVQDSQTNLRAALADPKLAAAMGKNTDQLKAAIAEGDRQIASLRKRQAGVDQHAASLARDTAAMQANTQGALAGASAYLQSGDAAFKAEARRKATTDATRKGTDAEKRYQDQLALSVAEAASAGAKTAAGLRDQAAARKVANDAVAAGAATAQRAEQAMQDELALQPLLIAQANARGKAIQVLAATVEAYRKALADLHVEEQRGAALAITQEQNDTAAALQRRQRLAGLAPADQFDEEGVKIASRRRLEAAKIDPASADGAKIIAQDVANARAERDTARIEAGERMLRDQQRQNLLLGDELTLVGKSADEADRMRAARAVDLELTDRGIKANSALGQAIRKAALAGVDLSASVRDSQRAFDEFKNTGEQVIDTVLDPNSWKDWHATGQKVIAQLISEFVKLALANPLKNAAYGESNPTLKSVGSAISSYFGGRSSVPAYADGTPYHPGGWADVGERGRERVWMPPGARVLTNAQTRAMDVPPPVIPARLPTPQGAGGGGSRIQIYDYRTNAAAPRVTQTPQGARVDLYDEVGRGMLRRGGETGDLARAARMTPPVTRYGG